MSTKCIPEFVVEVKPQEKFSVVVNEVTAEVVEVGMTGIQGPPGKDAQQEPLPVDPLDIYLQARGELKHGDDSQRADQRSCAPDRV